jgi:transposase
MSQITLLGVDTSKSKFYIHGVHANGAVAINKEFNRLKFEKYISELPPCRIAMEACSGSHHWGRTFNKLGHKVELIAAQKVAPFRLGKNKNDQNDAKAIVAAAKHPEIDFVSVKEIWHQEIKSLHVIRESYVKHITALGNLTRGLLAEFGVIVPQGLHNISNKMIEIREDVENKDALPEIIKNQIISLEDQMLFSTNKLGAITKILTNYAKKNETCLRLMDIEGVGVITATAILASVVDINLFKNGRSFSAWLGLTPSHTQTGGKDSKPIMGKITKKGDKLLRKLLVQGGMSVCSVIKREQQKALSNPKSSIKLPNLQTEKPILLPSIEKAKISNKELKAKSTRKEWVERLIKEKGTQKASVAYANRNARVIWALLKRGSKYIAEGILNRDENYLGV